MFFIRATLLLYCFQLIPIDALTKQEEIDNNKVEVEFYDLTDSKWEDKKENFQTSVSSHVTSFCEEELDTCGLTQWTADYEFTGSDVLQEGDSESDSASFTVYIYVKFNDVLAAAENDTTITSYILAKAALEDVLIEHRDDIDEEADVTITGIGNAEYSVKPDKTMNIIMILVSFGVLLLIIIVWIALYCWKKRTDKDMKKRRWEERRKKQWEARSATVSAVSKSKVVPIIDDEGYKTKEVKSVPPEATYNAAQSQPTSAPATSVNNLETTPTTSTTSTAQQQRNHGVMARLHEKKVQHVNSNYFRSDKEDVESGHRSTESLDESRNKSMESQPDNFGATAVFQAHAIDGHNDSYEKKKKKHKKKKSRHSEEREDQPAVISVEAEPGEKWVTVNDSRQESDSDNAGDLSRVGYRMC